MKLLPMVQLDLPGELPLEDGRYVVRPPGEPSGDADVLAIRTLGTARAKRGLFRSKGKPVAAAEEAPALRVSRVTLARAKPFGTAEAAEAWLQEVSDSEEMSKSLAAETARTLNRALRAHRAAAGDPYATDLHHGSAVAIRFGFGSGDELVDGRWTEAVEMPESGRRALLAASRAEVGPQERVAAVLGAREEVAPYEELLAGARRALAEGRIEEAAVMVEAAARSVERSGPIARRGGAAEVRLALRAPETDPPSPDQLRKMILELKDGPGESSER